MPTDFNNPSFLYRYRPLKDDGTRNVIQDELDLMEKGLIWLSNPKDLNDPFDCRPICHAEQNPRLDQLLSKFFVGSLSAIPPDDLEASPMWSYYGDNHRGICIEFPFDKNRAARSIPIEKVRYSNARLDIRNLEPEKMRITSPRRIGVVVPSAEVSDPDNNIDVLGLTHKSEAWRHEQEWRFIWPENCARSAQRVAQEEAEHGPRAEHKAFISRPSQVILGSQMDPGRKIALTELLKKIGIPTVEAHRSENEYKIEYRID